MDIEGAELQALDGINSHLEGVDRALVEVNPQHGIDIQEVINRLEKAGLTPKVLNTDRTETFVFARR